MMNANTQSSAVLESWSSISEKTVFVLDRSKYFTHVSSGHSIEGDYLKDPKKQQVEHFDRSLWTCAVEAVVGYSRLVWDLFTPDQRCISIVAGGMIDTLGPGDEQILDRMCSWKNEEQNLDHLLKALAKRSHCHQILRPDRLVSTEDISLFPNCCSDSVTVMCSLEQALNDLAHLTSAQQDRRSKSHPISSSATSPTKQTPVASTVANNGRIILISSFQNDQTIMKIVEKFKTSLERKNESLLGSSTLIPTVSPINYCDLVIINTHPVNDSGPCSSIANYSAFMSSLHVKVHSVRSGRSIGGLLNNLCLQHHNLKSTTITGIPMKEEQSSSSSSQYDVEIVHCSSIHADIMNSNSPLLEGVVEKIDRNGFPCDTFKLQWHTPRVNNVDLYHCLAASRITAVDINSRPSACLTNFLLGGRQVLLEIYKSKNNRMTTHVLASHNGELYIHSLSTANTKLNISDIPSVSDNLGGKVGDYRVNDFVHFIKQHILCKPALNLDDPISRTMNLVKRQTLYWPIVLGHTILLNIPNLIGGLVTRVPKESMSHADVEECKRILDDLIKHEKDGTGLPSLTIADITKTNKSNVEATKLNQLYKLLWNELEYFLRIHSTTPEHEAVLDYLIERRGGEKGHERGTKRTVSKNSATASSSASPVKKAKLSSQPLLEIGDGSTLAASQQQTAIFYKSGLSLYQTWSNLYHYYHSGKSKLPFAGRVHQKAVLYQHLNAQSSDQSTS